MNSSKVIEPNSTFLFNVSEEDVSIRLDTFLSNKFSAYSRSFFKKLINEGLVLVNEKIVQKPSYILKPNDEVIIKFPAPRQKIDISPIVNDLGIEIVFEHPDFLIINKPAGVLVHAANSNDAKFTLVEWLLAKFNEISKVGSPERPGIVHRLDMNTSGLIIIPRNNYAHNVFGDMFKNRLVKKTYLAVVQGHPNEVDNINYPIVRHPSGSKMACIKNSLKLPFTRGDIRQAETNYKVLEYFKDTALVEIKPVTGRTHQIRVHFACIGHPIIGDQIYGKKSKLIDRQALHAYKLEFEYEGKKFNFEAPIPNDMNNLIESLK